MTTKTEGQHKGEFIVQAVDADRGDISFEKGTYGSGHSTVADGTVLALSGGKLIPAAGTTHTDGTSDETIIGIAFGSYDTTAEIVGAYVARLAVVDTNLITTSGSKAALVAALATLMIIAR